MKSKSRILFVIAVVILLGSYFLPIWKIDLRAPQYPEGIGLRIWIDQITGANEHDLHNINKLNHYIGMKEIVPESIPELKIMPYIILAFIVLGLLAAWVNKIKLVYTWLIFLLITLTGGLVDFYLWEYDYGHNLDLTAPIKIPGMSYQPPFIGSEQILNMNALSMPDLGSYVIALTILLTLASLYLNRKKEIIK